MSYCNPINSRNEAAISHNQLGGHGHGSPPPDVNPPDATMRRAMRHVAAGDYQKAIDLLRSDGQDARIRNVRGVCLMRLGCFDAAICVLRELVMKPGCTWMRPEAPTVHKINFATALLLGGHPSGSLDMLAEIKAPTHPSIVRLQAAVDRWVSSLSFWQKLNWWIYGIVPANRPVTIDFLPGEFEVEGTQSGRPNPTPRGPEMRTAA